MRQDLEGFRPGLYLRVEVAGIPCEFVEHFNPSSPLIIGGLTNLEENVGYVQVSIPGGVLAVFASCVRSVSGAIISTVFFFGSFLLLFGSFSGRMKDGKSSLSCIAPVDHSLWNSSWWVRRLKQGLVLY